jgi:hypothetical protein
MTMGTELRRWMAATALLAVALCAGGCDSVESKNGASGPPAAGMSDEQTRAQVVDPARRLVSAAGWQRQDLSAAFHFASCNDQGDPPFQGVVELGFVFPRGADQQAEVERIAGLMVADGWSDGPPPGKMPYGRALHHGDMMAIVSPNPNHPGEGDVKIYGECGNQTNHRANDTLGLTDIADELT